MTSKADKLPLETEPVARDNNTILTLKRGGQTLSCLTQLIIVVTSSAQIQCLVSSKNHNTGLLINLMHKSKIFDRTQIQIAQFEDVHECSCVCSIFHISLLLSIFIKNCNFVSLHERVTDKNPENTNALFYIKRHINLLQALSWDTVQKNSTQKIKKAK